MRRDPGGLQVSGPCQGFGSKKIPGVPEAWTDCLWGEQGQRLSQFSGLQSGRGDEIIFIIALLTVSNAFHQAL